MLCRFVLLLLVLQYTFGNKVSWSDDVQSISVSNGYTLMVFNKSTATIDELSADFSGNGAFKTNTLSLPFSLQAKFNSKISVSCRTNLGKLKWVKQTVEEVIFKADIILRCGTVTLVSEVWTVSVVSKERAVNISIRGRILNPANVLYISHGVYSTSPSIYGLFDRGVAQMMGNNETCMGSQQPLSRVYTVGNGAALSIIRHPNQVNNNSRRTIVLSSYHAGLYASAFEDVIVGKYPNMSTSSSASAWSTSCWDDAEPVEVTPDFNWELAISMIPNNFDFPADTMNNVLESTSTVPFEQLRSFMTGIYASPVGCLQSYYDNQRGIIAPTISHPDVGYSPDTNFFDPDNFLSLSSMLYSGDEYLLHQVKNVLVRTAQTMCGIGEDQDNSYCSGTRVKGVHKQLHRDAINIFTSSPITTGTIDAIASGDGGRGSNSNGSTRDGQLMHHYIDLLPTYESIAGSEQLGPNIFWSLTVFRYIAMTQDIAFAKRMFPFIELSTQYVLSFYDTDKGLFLAPGPLWIDVLIRENYTSDSNTMLLYYLEHSAKYFDFMVTSVDASITPTTTTTGGSADSSAIIQSTTAVLLREIRQNVMASINKYLWDPLDGDHLVTQLNLDGSSIRDFVDYDANVMAVAFGAVVDTSNTSNSASNILARVDSGNYTHIRATWCSEVPYTGDAEDCYIVGGSVCGDSIATLGRIGWVDALSRKKVGDLRTFQEKLLFPLQQDLLKYVWLYERYDANGTQIRTPYYFEYPSLVVMLLWEVQYGIDIGLHDVTIDPFPLQVSYHITYGIFSIKYSQEEVVLKLLSGNNHNDANSTTLTDNTVATNVAALSVKEVSETTIVSSALEKIVTIHGMIPNAKYNTHNICSSSSTMKESFISSSSTGVLTFTALFSPYCIVTATLNK